MPFGRLGASFLTFRQLILARTSGAPWEAILASRDHPGGPWEQQDGLEVVEIRIFVDLGMNLVPVYVSVQNIFKIMLFPGLFPSHFFIDF